MIEFIKLMYLRIVSETPEFFLKLRYFFVGLTAACTAAWVTANTVGYQIPDAYLEPFKLITVVAAFAGGFTFLPTKDQNLQNKK